MMKIILGLSSSALDALRRDGNDAAAAAKAVLFKKLRLLILHFIFINSPEYCNTL
jgi:hypothetical protein